MSQEYWETFFALFIAEIACYPLHYPVGIAAFGAAGMVTMMIGHLRGNKTNRSQSK